MFLFSFNLLNKEYIHSRNNSYLFISSYTYMMSLVEMDISGFEEVICWSHCFQLIHSKKLFTEYA